MSAAEENKRHEVRITRPHIIRYRQIRPFESDKWDMAESIDLSKSAICFYSCYQFNPGDELEIKISNRLIAAHEISFIGAIIRSIPHPRVKSSFETVAKIEVIDKENSENFYKELEMFIQADSGRKRHNSE